MKLWILGCLAGTLLAQSPAFAVVADKFQCSIQLFQGAVPGPKSVSDLAIVRVPEAADPDWVPGVSATYGNALISLETSDVKVSYFMGYQLVHSASSGKAAQDTCIREIVGSPGDVLLFGCGRALPDTRPYDPTTDDTFYYQETPISSTGTPLFRSEVLYPSDIPIENFGPWSRAHLECKYLGTVE